MKLGTLFSMRFRVIKAIPVKIDRDPEFGVIAQWEQISEYGTGAHLSAALEDLAASVRDLCEVLYREKELGLDLHRVRRRLQKHIRIQLAENQTEQ